jgi:hypothetical protein
MQEIAHRHATGTEVKRHPRSGRSVHGPRPWRSRPPVAEHLRGRRPNLRYRGYCCSTCCRGEDTEGYAAASAECRRYFNINLTGHPISQDNDTGQGLEAYPHLIEQLVTVWNSPETDTFFKELIYDHRGGTRIGFEPGAYRDILLLRAIAQDALALAA